MNLKDPLNNLSAVDRRILNALLQQRGKISSRDTLARLAAVESLTSRRVDVSIVAIRRALGSESITTIRQRGWMLTPHGVAKAEILLAREVNITP